LIKLLVVDDSALMRKLLAQIFAAEPDFEVALARNGVEALQQLIAFEPDVVTLDVHMPEMDGLTCLDRIMVERPCPVVMVSALTADGAEATLEALQLGAVDFVAKPKGAVSLQIDDMAPELVAKVRSAARAKLPSSLRLRERVRHRIGVTTPRMKPRPHFEPAPGAEPPSEDVEGLVLVGVSTGGPPALEALLTALPGDFPWPILVAQHMPRSFTGPLARRLDGICELTVVEVTGPTLLEANCAYVARGDGDMIVSRRGGKLVAMPAPSNDYPWHPSADRLVRSAMSVVPAERLIGVLMTGMGDDGATAMHGLHMQGGRTIAESEDTAVVWGMPGELVQAGGADFIEPLPRIAARLLKLVS
jgi:two-component system, chemotaxis family, protein-glutamate methylesterase/glutaminase